MEDEEKIAEASGIQIMGNQESTADADIDIDELKREKTKSFVELIRF